MLLGVFYLILCIARAAPPSVAVPSGEEALGAPWTPLLVRMDEDWTDATVQASLDGEPLDDPGVVRARSRGRGGGVDWISSLDLGPLSPGEHDLRFSVRRGDGEWLLDRSFTIERGPVEVRLHLQDEEERPVAGRVLVLNEAGSPYLLLDQEAQEADPWRRDARLASVFAPEGEATLWLRPGTYTLVGTRGVREAVDARTLTLDEGLHELTLAVPRVVRTPGWVTADLHLHTCRSADSMVPDVQRWQAVRAAALDAVLLTDHNQVSPDPGLPDVLVIPGVEHRAGHHTTAHVNAGPLPPGIALPDTDPESFSHHLDALRALDPGVLLQLNHPRGIQFLAEGPLHPRTHALFTRMGYQRRRAPGRGPNAWMTEARPDTGTTALDFDAMEILNRLSWQGYLQVRQDWFALLRHGWAPTGTGNSDSHALAGVAAGSVVNLVDVEGELTETSLVEAVEAGRVSVSTGPVVDLVVRTSEGEAGPGGVLSGTSAQATVRVRAASWVPVPEVRLVVDGKVVERVRLDHEPGQLLDQSFSFELPDRRHDGFVLAEAGWPLGQEPEDLGLYTRVTGGAVPLGFTNPVLLDRDGGGWGP